MGKIIDRVRQRNAGLKSKTAEYERQMGQMAGNSALMQLEFDPNTANTLYAASNSSSPYVAQQMSAQAAPGFWDRIRAMFGDRK